MSKTWEFFENIDELVYVTDVENHELIYMNKKTREMFGFHCVEEVVGKKCYNVLQNSSMPCRICNNHELKPGYFKEWRYYNPILGRHLMLKDTILEEDGKRYRLELALDITNQVQWGNAMQNHQSLEAMINEGLRVAMKKETPSESINVLLEYLGKALKAERTYIFEKNDSGGDDNTYEWVANGVTPEKDNLQNVPPEVCAGWYQKFHEGKHIIIKDLEDIREADFLLYENLKRQNIHSLVVVPLYDESKVIGFYGVDNPPGKLLDYTSDMLQIMAHFILSSLKQRNLVRKLEERSYDIFYSLNVDYVGIYEADFDTDRCETYRENERLWNGEQRTVNFEDGYQAAMEKYIDLYVAEADQEHMRAMTEKSYVLAQLGKRKKFYVRYHVKENSQQVENFEIHFAGTGKEAEKNTVFFAFRNVDLIVEQEERYKLETQRNIENVLEVSRTGMWTIELEDGCAPRMYTDKTMRMLLGVKEDTGPEECYQSWFGNIDPEYVSVVEEAVQEILETGRSEVAYPWNHPTLGKIYVRCGGVPDRNYNKKGICLKGYHQDITETMVTRQKQDKALMEALAKAKQANLAKSEFLSHMSHDIRTPINGILGMLAISEKTTGDAEKQRECRAKIRVAAEHLLSLINDVLEISKLESGETSFVEEPFDICGILENCMTILSPKAQEMRLGLEIKEIDAEHTRVIGSPLHLRQILINIIGNAIKYNRPNGTVFVWARELSAQDGIARYRFVVEDTGIGIGEEFQKHIFEPFTQERQDARTNYNGTGLGMSITKKLVDQMGGTIELESEIGKGSKFTIIVPVKIDTQQEAQITEAQEDEPVDVSGIHVLLVEDNDINLEIVQYMLEDAGAVVVTAENGKVAVDTFAASGCGAFDCILMDLMMPVMNGLDAARAIRRLDRPDAADVPIIALSANAFEEDVKMTKEAGMNEHLTKPVDIEKMFKVIQKLRNRRTEL